MRPLSSRVVLGAGVSAALMLGGPMIAGAQPAPGAQAPSSAHKQTVGQLVARGIAAQDAKDYARAIELYEQAFALVQHPVMLFNIGQAHRLAGRADRAATFYERYLALDPRGSESLAARALLAAFYLDAAVAQLERARELEARESLERALRHGTGALGEEQLGAAQRQLREVERRLARIRVTCRTPGAEVTLDGETLFIGPGTYQGWVTAKAHELAAAKAGHPSDARRVAISAGVVQEIELGGAPGEAVEGSRRRAAWKPWAITAAGGAIAVAGGVLHARAARSFQAHDEAFQRLPCWSTPTELRGCRQDEIPSELHDRLTAARRQQAIAVGGYIAGASLIATGAVLLYLNRPRPAEQGAGSRAAGSVAVVPTVSRDMLGVLVRVKR